MGVYLTGKGQYGRETNSVELDCFLPVMNPTRAHRVGVVLSGDRTRSGGLLVIARLEVDGLPGVLFERTWSPDELAETYERTHHQVHGHDPRGLDPREGPTRLTVR